MPQLLPKDILTDEVRKITGKEAEDQILMAVKLHNTSTFTHMQSTVPWPPSMAFGSTAASNYYNPANYTWISTTYSAR